MAPTYKVTYFPIKGLGESIRYLLSYGGVEFEDIRISHKDLPNHKKDMPFGQVPLLEINGKMTHQSIAITRYLAKQFNLTGKDDLEDLEIDMVVDTVNDFLAKIAAFYYKTDEAVKAQRKEIFVNETIPYYMERWEAIAKTNNGHLALGKLTWADFYFAPLADLLKFYCGFDIFAGRENLQAVVNNVENLPAIKAWSANRPKTDLEFGSCFS